MKTKLLAAVLIWVCSFGFGNRVNAQWQTIFKDSVYYQCTSVYFINNDTGFVGTSCNNLGIYGGAILRTLNGGQTWDTTLFYNAIFSIHFLNDSVGFFGGQDGGVFGTTDMGTNWNQAGSFDLNDVFSIHFMSPDTGYKSNYAGKILQTIDGGANWQVIFSSSGGSYFPGTSRMVFADSSTGYLAQSFTPYVGSISKTIDKGLTWTDLNIPVNFYPYSNYFFNSNKGLAVGFNGKVSRTIDGGITWSSPDSIGPYPLFDILFVNDSIGYIVGGKNIYYPPPPTNGIIYKSIDAGITWQILDNSYYDGLLELHFPSDSVGYAVGMNGIILKISNANL